MPYTVWNALRVRRRFSAWIRCSAKKQKQKVRKRESSSSNTSSQKKFNFWLLETAALSYSSFSTFSQGRRMQGFLAAAGHTGSYVEDGSTAYGGNNVGQKCVRLPSLAGACLVCLLVGTWLAQSASSEPWVSPFSDGSSTLLSLQKQANRPTYKKTEHEHPHLTKTERSQVA